MCICWFLCLPLSLIIFIFIPNFVCVCVLISCPCDCIRHNRFGSVMFGRVVEFTDRLALVRLIQFILIIVMDQSYHSQLVYPMIGPWLVQNDRCLCSHDIPIPLGVPKELKLSFSNSVKNALYRLLFLRIMLFIPEGCGWSRFKDHSLDHLDERFQFSTKYPSGWKQNFKKERLFFKTASFSLLRNC